MGSDWTTLGEYIKVQGGFAYKSQDFLESSPNKVLKIKNVRFGAVDYSETAYISDDLALETSSWSTREGDILISMTGSGPNAPQSLVGRVARVWKDEPKAWINQRVGRVLFKEQNNIHPDFVYYLLTQQSSQEFLVSNSSGSANQANISAKTIERVPCPRIGYQASKKVSEILTSLDETIILNKKINQTLEQMAQAMFKSWFVDFDPIFDNLLEKHNNNLEKASAYLTAKGALDLIPKLQKRHTIQQTSNYKPLPDHIKKEFPNDFQHHEDMGWIPDEWQDKKVRDLLELKYGKGLKKSERIEGHYPVYGSGGINGYHNSYLVEGPGVIVGRKGTVGTVFWESKSFFPIDTTFYVVPRKNIPLQFCYYLLKGLGLDTMNTDAAVQIGRAHV